MWPKKRQRTAIVSTLLQRTITSVQRKFSGTRPLHGDWDIVRLVLAPDAVGTVNAAYYWGVRLATDVSVNDKEWLQAERLWYGDLSTNYFGDGFCLPINSPIVIEGPFRIRPRGRRLVVRFSHNLSGSRFMALTFVLRQV